MALALDAISQRSATETGITTATWSHTCTGGDLVLIVAIGLNNARTISGVTYAGTAMTFGARGVYTANNARSEIWYLGSPATGANNIVVTFSANGAEHGSGGISFTGANTGSPIGATGQTDEGAATLTPTTNVTTQFANSIVVDIFTQQSIGGTVAIDAAGNTENFQFNTSAAAGRGGSSREPVAAPGAMVIGWSNSSSNPYSSAAVEVKDAATAAGGSVNRRMRLGIG